MDRTVTMNGKEIKKILVNEKEFFGDDIRVSTKNLNADLIEKVQVLDDREGDPDKIRDGTQVDKIINLKLKTEIRKRIVGKFHVGG